MSLEHILNHLGYIAIFGTIFLETGFLFGIFLPGDSLLFTAGILAADKKLAMSAIIGSAFVAAVLGYTIAYFLGEKFGPKIFNKPESLIFKKSNIEKTHRYFSKYGTKIILFARLIPIVRTIVPILAGIADMEYGRFMTYNILGGILWSTLIPFVGYYFGKIVPNAEIYIGPLFIMVILISFIPTIRHVLKTKEGKGFLKKIITIFKR